MLQCNKKEHPMTTQSTSSFTPPFFAANAVMDPFMAMWREHTTRMQHWMHELASLEEQAFARAKVQSQQMASLTEGTLGYLAQLSADWRKLATSAMASATEQQNTTR